MTAADWIINTGAGRIARRSGWLALGAGLILSACAEREVILPGAREDVRAGVVAAAASAGASIEGMAAPRSGVALALPAMRGNADWTQRGGNAAHDAGHVALGAGLNRIWSANIGQGSGKRHRISADPIVAGGVVYAMDSQARVTAVAANGGTVWSSDVTPPGESAGSASGGGLAYGEGRVFATSGFGELVALDARTGTVQWRQRVRAPIGGAPAYADGLVYVVGRDGSGWAVRASDGRVQWTAEGTPGNAGVTGVAAPAVDPRMVVFPQASGEVNAALRQGGMPLWTAHVAGQRLGRAIGSLSDLTGEPVIRGNTVYAANSAGQMAALSAGNGEVIWTAREGAMSAPVVAGNAVFVVNDQNQLVRLDAANGGRVWAVDLPYFQDRRPKKMKAIYASYGPVLAGGRLFVASGDGLLRAFDPTSGAMVGSAPIPGGAASAPVVAGQVLYVMGRNGQLNAYR
ncbi:PQQ-binding-like beta-propeller repeat protein [Paracoccus sp. p4-l81]|uniref:outer membrane protein assembly factor BamB family protein n=1 Tax=unclassified Paracoccus (in: a-proteobacteria) TaxID=2688777 RepID=UPI0035B77614